MLPLKQFYLGFELLPAVGFTKPAPFVFGFCIVAAVPVFLLMLVQLLPLRARLPQDTLVHLSKLNQRFLLLLLMILLQQLHRSLLLSWLQLMLLRALLVLLALLVLPLMLLFSLWLKLLLLQR